MLGCSCADREKPRREKNVGYSGADGEFPLRLFLTAKKKKKRKDVSEERRIWYSEIGERGKGENNWLGR